MNFKNIASYICGGGIFGFSLGYTLGVWLDIPWMYTYAALIGTTFSLLFYLLAALATPQHKKQRLQRWFVIASITVLFASIALDMQPHKSMADFLAIFVTPLHLLSFGLFELYIKRQSQLPPPHFGRPPDADTKPTSSS